MKEMGKIYLGDCLELMSKLPNHSIDAVITDPPFAFAGGISTGRGSMVTSQFFLYWWKDVCKELDRILKLDAEGFCWCNWHCSETMMLGFNFGQKYGLRLAQIIFHYREMPGLGRPFRNSVDMIAYLRGPKSKGKRIPNTTHNWISKYWYYGKHPNHPAEKDIKIVEQLIEWCSDEGNIIIDPFIGSGTTAIACINTNRRYIGFELEKQYFDIAQSRLEKVYYERSKEFSNKIT